jgi:hypothetical protein
MLSTDSEHYVLPSIVFNRTWPITLGTGASITALVDMKTAQIGIVSLHNISQPMNSTYASMINSAPYNLLSRAYLTHMIGLLEIAQNLIQH